MMFSQWIETLDARICLSADAPAVADAAPARPIPVLDVPGLLGSLPEDQSTLGVFKFLVSKKPYAPSSLHPVGTDADPLLNDLSARPGYTLGDNVFFAAYDSRQAVAPRDRANDGVITLGRKLKFNDKSFTYGIQSLQYWIDQAKAAWVKDYGDANGFQVDIVAHSMGGVVARALIQSNHYAQTEPGVVRNLVLVGTPNEGAVDAARARKISFTDLLSGGANALFPTVPQLPLSSFASFLPHLRLDSIAKSLNDLLPTFSYSSNAKAPHSQILTDLNADVTQTAAHVSHVDEVYGSGLSTSAFLDGAAITTSDAGDGTVLVQSANLPGLGTPHEFAGIEHSQLIDDATSAATITSYLPG